MNATLRPGATSSSIGGGGTGAMTPRRLDPIASPGRRAMDRVAEKNRRRAEQVRKERHEMFHRDLAKAPQGDAAGGGPPVAAHSQVVKLSEVMNKRMVDLFIDPAQRCWYKFFIHMDDDCSGKVNYEELVDMVRNELSINTSMLPESDLQALWRALDEDNSGLITAGEFGHFMRLGQHVHEPREPWKERRSREGKERAAAIRSEKDVLLADLKKRLEVEQEARRQKATDAFNSIWGGSSTMSTATSSLFSASALSRASGASGASTAREPWRSPRALMF